MNRREKKKKRNKYLVKINNKISHEINMFRHYQESDKYTDWERENQIKRCEMIIESLRELKKLVCMLDFEEFHKIWSWPSNLDSPSSVMSGIRSITERTSYISREWALYKLLEEDENTTVDHTK